MQLRKTLTRISPLGGEHDGLADTHINATAFKRPSLFTIGDYQLGSYYGADGKLRIARRTFREPAIWQIIRTSFESAKAGDPHNVSVIAADGEGFLHLSWGMHNHSLRYTRSTAPVTNDEPILFHSPEICKEIALHDQPITYPEFTAIPRSGDLLFMFRTGRAGAGDYHLFRWSVQNRHWTPLNAAVGGSTPWITGRPNSANHTLSNPYVSNLAIDDQSRIHVAWTWRSGRNSRTEFKDYQTNHNILYARSAPLDTSGPLRWFDSNERLYDSRGIHSIDEDNSEPVVLIPEGSSLINTCSLTLDRSGEPMVATWYSPLSAFGDHTRQYMLLYKRGSHWKHIQVGDRSPELPGRLPETLLRAYPMARPIVAYQPAHSYVVLRDYQRGGRASVAISDDGSLRHWTIHDLTENDTGQWEPSYDAGHLLKNDILSMLYQRSGQSHLSSWPAPSKVVLPEVGFRAFGGWRYGAKEAQA